MVSFQKLNIWKYVFKTERLETAIALEILIVSWETDKVVLRI